MRFTSLGARIRTRFRPLVCLITLVALHSCPPLKAQSLDDLSEGEKAKLLEQYQGSRAVREESAYQSPPLLPEQPAAGQPAAIRPEASAAQAGSLPAFADLRPFGVNLFAGPREVLPPNDIASDDDYILGPGDEIIIYLWGRADKEFRLTVDREGKIFIPKVGDLIAWGKKLGEFKTEARKRLSTIYAETDLTISLGKIRSIRIFLTGEVTAPGAYTVSSLTSMYNALYLAGGPNANGSMRSVQLKRGGKTLRDHDLYGFLLEGDKSFDVRLASGDVIFVPVAGPRVAIRGEVTRPAIYELKQNETVSQLIDLAGGVTAHARLDRVQLERIAGENEWKAYDLDLSSGPTDSTGKDMLLSDGDRVTVGSVFGGKRNIVAIFGKVKYPGYYERSDTTTLTQLIARGQLQDYDVYLAQASLFRRHSDWRTELIPFDLQAVVEGRAEDIALQDRDSVYVYSMQEVSWGKRVHIVGEVKRPGEYLFYPGMTVQDLVFLAGSFSRSAFKLWAELARTDEKGDVTIQRLELTDDRSLELPLEEDDRLYVRQIPEWQLHPSVSLTGEVQFPGEYILGSRDETLHQLIQRAGGFTPEAFPTGTVFLRGSISQRIEGMKLRQQLEKSAPLVEDTSGQLQHLTFVEFEAGSVDRIALNMERLIKTEGEEGDVVLMHGDHIHVPSVPSGISVVGAVGLNGTILFRDNKNVKYYVEQAGGFTKRADENETRLIRADGTAYGGGGTLGRKVRLGDVIAVPTKVEREGRFTQNLVAVLTIASATLTTILLITKI